MTRLSLACAALLAALAPAALADTLIARCGGEGGASFHTSPLEADQAALTLGPDLTATPPAGSTLVLRDDAAPRWSGASPRDIHAECGGEGTPVIDLFPAFRARDGVWRAQITDTQLTGCPAAAASVAAGLGAASNTTTIDWPDPFTPAPLFSGHAAFRQTGLMRWRGVLDRQSGDAVAASVIVYITVRSPTRMEGRSVMTLRFAPMLARMMGGAETCRSITTARYDWEG